MSEVSRRGFFGSLGGVATIPLLPSQKQSDKPDGLTVYIVIATHFEENDNHQLWSTAGGYPLEVAFWTEEEARQEIARRQKKILEEEEPLDFDWDDNLDDNLFLDLENEQEISREQQWETIFTIYGEDLFYRVQTVALSKSKGTA